MIFTAYDYGRWDIFEMITTAWYGKQCYFLDGCPDTKLSQRVYSRVSGEYMCMTDAFDEFLKEVSDG